MIDVENDGRLPCRSAVSVMCTCSPRDGMSWRVPKAAAIAGAYRRYAGVAFSIQRRALQVGS